MKDISEYTNELYKRIDEKTEALGKRPLFKLRGKDNDSSKKEVGVMSVRRKSLIIVTIVLIGAIVLGATFVVSGRMSIKDPNPERASDPDKGWIGDDPYAEDYVKENMPDVTYRIDGRDIVFSYVKSNRSAADIEYCLGGEQVVETRDYYDSAEGYTIIKSGDSKRINGFYTNDYSPVRGDENTKFLSAGGIKGRALEIITNSDTDMAGLENAKVVWDDQITDYSVTLTCDSGKVYMTIDTSGALRSFTLKRYSDASEKRKEAAREMMREKLEDLEDENPYAKYELLSEEFTMVGDDNYARFAVLYYSDKDSAYCDELFYTCII